MAIVDLNACEQRAVSASTDVCIVGAGAAGLYLANRLAREGLSVIVLEAGGPVCGDGPSVGIEAKLAESRYGGVSEGRAFGLGGTTALWGGQLVPHSDLDLRESSIAALEPWRHIVSVVRKHSAAVNSTLGLGEKADYFTVPAKYLRRAMEPIRARGLEIVASECLPFRRRNLAFLASETGNYSNRIRVYVHAVAASWRLGSGPRGTATVKAVTGMSPDGNTVKVTAGAFIVAGGAIESARILLEIRRQSGADPFRPDAAIGRGLSDHLSCHVADIERGDWPRIGAMFGPRFLKGRMRSFRLVERTPRPTSPRCFYHFIFDNQNPGFQVARKVLAALQLGKPPALTFREIVNGTNGLTGLVFGRLVKSRLGMPRFTPVHLQLDIEQERNEDNAVLLGDGTDAYGRPVAIVRWKVHANDRRRIRGATDRIFELWPGPAFGFPALVAPARVESEPKPHDVYHPVGICQLGNGVEAVVDADLRVHGTDNLYVASTAVFPSAGTANPTFSMLCLAHALAERLGAAMRPSV